VRVAGTSRRLRVIAQSSGTLRTNNFAIRAYENGAGESLAGRFSYDFSDFSYEKGPAEGLAMAWAYEIPVDSYEKGARVVLFR